MSECEARTQGASIAELSTLLRTKDRAAQRGQATQPFAPRRVPRTTTSPDGSSTRSPARRASRFAGCSPRTPSGQCPATAGWPGSTAGATEIFRFLARCQRRPKAPTRSRLIDVLASDDRAAALYRASGQRRGRRLDLDQVLLFTIAGRNGDRGDGAAERPRRTPSGRPSRLAGPGGRCLQALFIAQDERSRSPRPSPSHPAVPRPAAAASPASATDALLGSQPRGPVRREAACRAVVAVPEAEAVVLDGDERRRIDTE